MSPPAPPALETLLGKEWGLGFAPPPWLPLPETTGALWALRFTGRGLELWFGAHFRVLWARPEHATGAPTVADDTLALMVIGARSPRREQAAARVWRGLGSRRAWVARWLRVLTSSPDTWSAGDTGPLLSPIRAAAMGEATDPACRAATWGVSQQGDRGSRADHVALAAGAAALLRAGHGSWESALVLGAQRSEADPGPSPTGTLVRFVCGVVGGDLDAAERAAAAVWTTRPQWMAACCDALVGISRVSRIPDLVQRMPPPCEEHDVEEQWAARAGVLRRVGDEAGADDLVRRHIRSDPARFGGLLAPVPDAVPIDDPEDRRAVVGAQSRLWAEGPVAVLRGLDVLRDRFPRSELVWTYAGEVHLWLGRYDRAAECFERALELYSRSRWGHVGLAAVAMLAGALDDAAALLEQVARVATPSPMATTHSIAGELARRRGDLATAERELRTAVDAKATRFASWLNLAWVLRARGDHDGAARAAARFSALAPGPTWEARAALGLAPGTTVAVEELDALLEPLLASFRGNRSSGYVTFFVADGTFRATTPELTFLRRFASWAGSASAADPALVSADIAESIRAARRG